MLRWRWVFIALVLCCAAGCDSDSPLLSDSDQLVELHFTAVAAPIFEANIWDRFVDSNGNGRVDPGETASGAYCEYVQVDPALQTAPWPLLVSIRVIRGGTVTQELLTRANAATTFSSLSDENTGRAPGPATPESPEGGFAYSNPRHVPETSYDFLDSCWRPDVPAIPETGQLGGLPVPVQIPLAKGDTLVVTAVQAPVEAAAIMPYVVDAPMEVTVLANGVAVVPDGITMGPTINFSYQNR